MEKETKHQSGNFRLIKGNLLDLAEAGEFDIVVQGCNCFCTMGAGLAKQIKERYPEAYAADCKTGKGDYMKLGNYTLAKVQRAKNSFIIVNAYTQYGYNKRGENADVFEYISFKLILQKLAHSFPGARFGFPMIGMGLAGGNKKLILSMLSDFAEELKSTGGTVTVVEFEA